MRRYFTYHYFYPQFSYLLNTATIIEKHTVTKIAFYIKKRTSLTDSFRDC